MRLVVEVSATRRQVQSPGARKADAFGTSTPVTSAIQNPAMTTLKTLPASHISNQAAVPDGP
jgi:hypothetical protein